MKFIYKRRRLKKYNLGEVWWSKFPFQEVEDAFNC